MEPEVLKLLQDMQSEIVGLRTKVDDIHLLFKPTLKTRKLTKKQLFDLEVKKKTAEMKVNMMTNG